MQQALVLISIVLGVAITLELGNLNRLLRAKKVRWHWAQPVFAFFILMAIIYFWWSLARETGDITIGEFLPIMYVLIILTLLAGVSLPEHIGENGVDLAEYYQENRRYMWGTFAFGMAPFAAQAWLGWRELVDGGQWQELAFVTAHFLTMVTLAFVRSWWLVGLGFAILSLAPIAWLSQTL